ncbi:hypothetical protein A7318_18230 [Pseudomonas lurida]|nr:hypothetical protein A7318_18230 [Pseudomonas lurida]VVN02440.1 hypothetical protein PS663_03406 [Pseudomonas fluorescens]
MKGHIQLRHLAFLLLPLIAACTTPDRSRESEVYSRMEPEQPLQFDNCSVGCPILTEKAACASCLNVAEQFRAKYPNITVNIFDNQGVMLRPPRKTP